MNSSEDNLEKKSHSIVGSKETNVIKDLNFEDSSNGSNLENRSTHRHNSFVNLTGVMENKLTPMKESSLNAACNQSLVLNGSSCASVDRLNIVEKSVDEQFCHEEHTSICNRPLEEIELEKSPTNNDSKCSYIRSQKIMPEGKISANFTDLNLQNSPSSHSGMMIKQTYSLISCDNSFADGLHSDSSLLPTSLQVPIQIDPLSIDKHNKIRDIIFDENLVGNNMLSTSQNFQTNRTGVNECVNQTYNIISNESASFLSDKESLQANQKNTSKLSYEKSYTSTPTLKDQTLLPESKIDSSGILKEWAALQTSKNSQVNLTQECQSINNTYNIISNTADQNLQSQSKKDLTVNSSGILMEYSTLTSQNSGDVSSLQELKKSKVICEKSVSISQNQNLTPQKNGSKVNSKSLFVSLYASNNLVSESENDFFHSGSSVNYSSLVSENKDVSAKECNKESILCNESIKINNVSNKSASISLNVSCEESCSKSIGQNSSSSQSSDDSKVNSKGDQCINRTYDVFTKSSSNKNSSQLHQRNESKLSNVNSVISSPVSDKSSVLSQTSSDISIEYSSLTHEIDFSLKGDNKESEMCEDTFQTHNTTNKQDVGDSQVSKQNNTFNKSISYKGSDSEADILTINITAEDQITDCSNSVLSGTEEEEEHLEGVINSENYTKTRDHIDGDFDLGKSKKRNKSPNAQIIKKKLRCNDSEQISENTSSDKLHLVCESSKHNSKSRTSKSCSCNKTKAKTENSFLQISSNTVYESDGEQSLSSDGTGVSSKDLRSQSINLQVTCPVLETPTVKSPKKSYNMSDVREFLNNCPFSELRPEKKRKNYTMPNESFMFQDRKVDEEKEVLEPGKQNKNYANYKAPRLKKPKKWVTKKLYNFLFEKLLPIHGIRYKLEAEKLVMFMVQKVTEALNMEDGYDEPVEELKMELAKKSIVETNRDFFDFVKKFLEFDFYLKSVPTSHPQKKKQVVRFKRGTMDHKIIQD
uniref:Uncharacterized protein n=1 Tax=Clastoptera arizonana TaxID=38151 RepID=A0A1B6CH65_9HEMI